MDDDWQFDEVGHQRMRMEAIEAIKAALAKRTGFLTSRDHGQFREGAILNFAEELIEKNFAGVPGSRAGGGTARLSDLSESNRSGRITCATEIMQMNLRDPGHEDSIYAVLALYDYLEHWNRRTKGTMSIEEDKVLLPALGGILMRGIGPAEIRRRMAGGGDSREDASAWSCVYALDKLEGLSREEVAGMLPSVFSEIEKGERPELVGKGYEILGYLLGFEEFPRIIAGLKNPHDSVKKKCANTILNVFADNGKYLVASRHVPPAVVALHKCMGETEDDRVFMTAAAAIFVSRMGPREAKEKLAQNLGAGRYEGPRSPFGPAKARGKAVEVVRLPSKGKK